MDTLKPHANHTKPYVDYGKERGGQAADAPLYTPQMLRVSDHVIAQFRSHLVIRGSHSGRVAQLVEQVTFNHWVTGSNPVALTTSKPLSPCCGTAAFLCLCCLFLSSISFPIIKYYESLI